MNYQKIYDLIIQKANQENRKKYKGIYYEKHHILPICLGGSDDNINQQKSTLFVINYLLIFIHIMLE